MWKRVFGEELSVSISICGELLDLGFNFVQQVQQSRQRSTGGIPLFGFAFGTTTAGTRRGSSLFPYGVTCAEVVEPFVSLTNILDEVYSAAVAVNAYGGRFFEPGPRRAFSVGLSATLQ